jgi:exopolysaccharide biosynthesis protein
MVVVDGRQPGVNRGLDLYEFADLMAELGCRDALNLDGGGSSTMVRDGKVQNRPSDGSERRVSTAIVIKPAPRPPMYAGGSSGLLEAAL